MQEAFVSRGHRARRLLQALQLDVRATVAELRGLAVARLRVFDAIQALQRQAEAVVHDAARRLQFERAGEVDAGELELLQLQVHRAACVVALRRLRILRDAPFGHCRAPFAGWPA